MSSPIPLGIQNPLGPSKPLGRDRRLSTVFLPEHFARTASEVFTTQPTDSPVNVEEHDREERSQYRTKHDSPTLSPNNSDRSSLNVWPTVVQSLSQIQPLNQSTMESSSAIAPEIASDIASDIALDIVFDRPGSNKSLVPLQNTDSDVSTSWSLICYLWGASQFLSSCASQFNKPKSPAPLQIMAAPAPPAPLPPQKNFPAYLYFLGSSCYGY